jgi:hypothetical protein
MRALSSADCLDLWERGLRLHPLDQGLLALGAALPETSYESLADWSLGHRNSVLAEIHSAYFQPNLHGQTSCPMCAEQLEFQMDARAFIRRDPGPSVPIVVKGHAFRLPSTRDLARAVRESDPRVAVIELVESCSVGPAEATAWSDEDLEEIGDSMASADPLAETCLQFDCVKCGHKWDEALAIVAFLWMEIEARAKRLLTEVHTLAAAYGWTEKEILSLSEPRRRLYLEMVHA